MRASPFLCALCTPEFFLCERLKYYCDQCVWSILSYADAAKSANATDPQVMFEALAYFALLHVVSTNI